MVRKQDFAPFKLVGPLSPTFLFPILPLVAGVSASLNGGHGSGIKQPFGPCHCDKDVPHER